MSGNRPQGPPRNASHPNEDETEEQHQFATELVRSILDDRPSIASVSPSGELYRAIERFHRNINRVRLGIAESRTSITDTRLVMPPSSDRDLLRRFNRDPQTTNNPVSHLVRSGLPPPPSLPPLRSLGTRLVEPGLSSPAPSGSRSTRARLGAGLHSLPRGDTRERSMQDFVRSFDHLDRNLADANQRLRELLNITNVTMPSIPQSTTTPQTRAPDHAEESRRVKRRKLESNRAASAFKGFRYGKYGQAEPGELKMEMVSCDGGMYPHESVFSYSPENILKNDTSVYCTKGSRCNIVLQHQGGTVFSLSELVIKAPESNKYTSPVREGMVFLSMDDNDLLSRTTQYQIQYLPARATPRERAPAGENDPAAPSTQSAATSNWGVRVQTIRQSGEAGRTPQIPAEFQAMPSAQNVTIDYSDDDKYEARDDLYSAHAHTQTPNLIGTFDFEGDNSGDEGEPRPRSVWRLDDRDRLPPIYSSSGLDPYPLLSRVVTLAEAQEASQIATQEAVRAVGGAMMSPLAHFFIEKGKKKCTIRFQPPITGRFLLLKVWSPQYHRNRNIDIQGVTAKGFAGPRYVPSAEPM